MPSPSLNQDQKIPAAQAGLDPARLPRHVAIIMDGNGRWARARGLVRVAGHRAGVESVRGVVRGCAELGIEALTLYAFSTENWSRPESEVGELMRLLCWALRSQLPDLDNNDVRLRAIGRLGELPAAVQEELKNACAALQDNKGLVLTLALNYGSRAEIVDAVNRILLQAAGKKEEGRWKVNEHEFAAYLDTAGLPELDLVIRTSGEMRLSNFLLWQCAYAELYVTPTLWPDFGREAFLEAIREYQRRIRRFGAL